uniref:hypothetical protein n=1 Tax=Amycolatopsis sp. CA-151526 TaxID=3239921 RepID=UPI003F49498D
MANLHPNILVHALDERGSMYHVTDADSGEDLFVNDWRWVAAACERGVNVIDQTTGEPWELGN